MSIASGYSVDLYCDCEDCLASHTHREYQGGRGEYVGESWTECKQAARRAELCWAAMIAAAPAQEDGQ